ncbi:MAG: hypothetical protein AAF713_10460 [Pseudomonadota bacterium]
MTFSRIAAVLALSTAAVAAPPAAARDGNDSLRDFKRMTAEARAAGGYPTPFGALVDAMTGEDEADTQAAEQPGLRSISKSRSGEPRGYTGQ